MTDRDVFLFALSNHMGQYSRQYFSQRSHIQEVIAFYAGNCWKAISPDAPAAEWVRDAESIAVAYFQGV